MAHPSTRTAIVAALARIAPPVERDGRAVVENIGDAEAAVGRDQRGWATLLLPPADPRAVAVRLENLEFDPAAQLLLCTEAGHQQRVVRSRVSCRAESRTAAMAFCSAAAALVDEVASDPRTDIPARIAGFVELFRNLTRQVASADVVGLWGELALIAFARSPSTAATAWHADPDDLIDFELDGTRVEVKTTRDLTRAHWFSLDQVSIAQLTDVSLASIIAVPAHSGLSIADLLELATDRLTETPDLAQRVVDIATRTVGDALATSTARFDRRATMRSLQLYSFDEVPQVATSDDRILELRWRATLANAQPWDEATVQESRLLRALPAVRTA